MNNAINGHITVEEFKDAVNNFIDRISYLIGHYDWFVDQFENDMELVHRKQLTCSTLENKLISEYLMVEYRIGYSHSYQVPLLSIKIQTPDGSPVYQDTFWSILTDKGTSALDKNMFFAFSQIEHPHLGIPFYQYHPCKTAELMSKLLYSDENRTIQPLNYLLLWTSTIGGPLGLNLPLPIVGTLYKTE